jgi:hypothetical protein
MGISHPIRGAIEKLLIKRKLSQIQRAFPRLEPALVEIRLDVAFFYAGNKFFVIVPGAVFGHELGANIEDLSAGDDNGCITDFEFIVRDLRWQD